MKELPRIGQIVPVRVTHVIAGGLFVDLVGGDAKGFIRKREVAPTAPNDPNGSANWKEQYKSGSELAALVIDRRENGHLELSLRQVKHDPWRNIANLLQIDQLVSGVVVNVEAYGVFIELPQGVTGLLHVSKLPLWVSGAAADLFWPGDHINVIVESIDASDRRVPLTMAGLTERRWPHATQSTSSAANPPTLASTAGVSDAPIKLPLELLLEHPPQRILVVEDDREHREQLSNWLRRAGQNVYAASSGEEALDAGFQPDVALVDLGLPGMTGGELLHQLLESQPDLHAIMMTADYLSEAETHALEARGYKLYMKPLGPEEMYEILLNKTARPQEPVQQLDPRHVIAQPESQFVTTVDGPESIVNILRTLLNQSGAKKAIVFALDPVQRKVDVLAQAGRGAVDSQALPGLIRSPVRNVAEDELTVHTEDVRTNEAEYRYLLRLLPFESCIGAPIGANLSTRNALFVFHTRRAAFASNARSFVTASALAIANILERQSFIQQSSDLQRLALLGQLSRALVHEVNHRLSPMPFALDTLQAEFRDLEHLIEKLPQAGAAEFALAAQEFHHTDQSLARFAQAVRALVETAKLFGQMAKIDQETGVLVLSEVANEVANLLRDAAKKQRVLIHIDPPERLIATRTQITLVRQVLINVVLNAIQQIGLYRPKEGGQVRISFGERWDGEQRMVYFQVEDDGPGIHRRLWNQIFQLGYTTRKDGSGLGLHISRSLIESLRGRIQVVDSHLYWGTVFLIELPLRS